MVEKMDIKNIKKCILTFVALVCGVVAGNTVTESGIISTSYASDKALDSVFGGFKLEFDGEGNNMTVRKEGVNTANALNSMIKFIKWIALIGSIVLLGVFVLNLIKMGTAGTNVQARTAAQQGLVWSGISAAVLTISTTIFFFLQGALA